MQSLTDDSAATPSAIGFEWDENKRRLNITKHGIDFEDAKRVFDDPSAYMYRSPQSALEQRFVAVGTANGVLVAVIYTRRERIRIISARIARRSERQAYG